MKFEPAKNFSDDYPVGWPSKKYFVNQHNVTRRQLEEFRALVEKDTGETEIDKYLRENLEILSIALSFFSTGHQGAWIIPQQEIKPPTHEPGLKPDYLIGGNNSEDFLGGLST